jgi:site-specific recombinase XerD
MAVAVVPQRQVEQLVTDFLGYLEFERGLSRNTLEAYRADLAQFADYLDAHGLDVLSVKHAELAGFLTMDRLRRRRCSATPLACAPSTAICAVRA